MKASALAACAAILMSSAAIAQTTPTTPAPTATPPATTAPPARTPATETQVKSKAPNSGSHRRMERQGFHEFARLQHGRRADR